MTMYLPLGPDGMLPEGAEPGSPRYERVLATELRAGLRLPVGAAGVALIAAGAVIMYFGIPLGILGWIAGGGALVAGATGGFRGFDFRESPDGTFVRATPEHEAETWYAAMRTPAVLPRAYRIVTGVLGTLAAIVLVLEIVDPGDGLDDWKTLLLVAALAAGLLYLGIIGRVPFDADPELLLPPRFKEFADPTRPLPPEAFAIPGPPRERAAEPAARTSRPTSSERTSPTNEG